MDFFSKKHFVKTPIYDKLDEVLLTSKYGSGLRLLIKGEKGIGKKVMTNYIKDNFRNRDPLVLEGYSDSLESSYSPIARVFYDIIEQSIKTKKNEIIALDIANELLRLVPILGQYANIMIEFYKNFISEFPQEVRELQDIYYQIQLIISKLTKRGDILLILHNIENYDFASLSLLSILAGINNFRLHLIITFDDNELEFRTQSEIIKLKELEYELSYNHNFMCFIIVPFSLQQTKEYLILLLGENSFLKDEEILSFHEKCGGNPFFIKELIVHLKQENLLVFSNQQYILKPNNVINTLPDSLKRLIELKLYRLQNELREIVDVAAVIGYEFSYKPIVELLKQEPVVILRRLNDLKNIHNLIVELKQKHKFTYKAIQETIYNMLGPNLAKEYHLFLAKYFEADPIENDNEYILYYHYLNAGELRKSLIHLNNSAIDAKKSLSYEVEANRYQRMIDLLLLLGNPAEEEIQKIKLFIAEALYNSGQFSKVITFLNDFVQKSVDRKVHAKVMLYIAKAQYLCEEYDKPKEILENLLKNFYKELEGNDLVASRLLLAAILYHIGEWDQGRNHYRKCFRIPVVLKDKEISCTVLKRINMFYIPELALPKLVEGLSKLDKEKHLYWEIYNNIGCNYLFLNNILKAKKNFTECIDYFQSNGSYREAYPLNNLSIIEIIEHHLDKALIYIEKIKAISISDFDFISASSHEAIVYILKKETKKGIEILNGLFERIKNSSEIILKENICHNLGWAYMQIGHYQEAAIYLIKSIPKRKHPWLEFKIGKTNRLLQQIASNGIKIPAYTNFNENIELLKRSGRKDSWLYLSLDYEFSEVWFWE